MKIYKKEGQVAERPHLNLPPDTFEEEIGLEGFFGPVSHLYHRHAPTSWADIRRSEFQWPALEESREDFLKPHCFSKVGTQTSTDFFKSAKILLWNEDLALWAHCFDSGSSAYFRNADASELYFCHEGELDLESSFGVLSVAKGDYVHIPKGVTYRWQSTQSAYLLRIESFTDGFKKPETGIMGQQALYHEEAIKTPKFEPGVPKDKSSVVRIQKDHQLTEVEYAFDLRDLSGWCGTLYPHTLSVKEIAPAMSPIAHLPPSINSTFVCRDFIVCTFLPRPLEEPEGALKVPFYHSNIDYDEVIFYHEGDFFSRDHMEAGAITLHPRGINHGPQPKAIAAQHSMKRTNEIAVMIDSVKPLKMAPAARALEIKDYWKSWQQK